MTKKLVCPTCGEDRFDDGFLATENGILYIVSGKPDFKNQIAGKRKNLSIRICRNCRFCLAFAPV